MELKPAPGVVSAPTKGSSTLNWADANLIRWEGGKMTPIGGWTKVDYAATASPIRRVFQWRSNNDLLWTAILCEEHLYVDEAGVLIDITPVGGIEPPVDVESGGYGDWEYSEDTYGTGRPPVINRKRLGPMYTLDNWGENLLAMTSADGRLLQWVPPGPGEEIAPAAAVEGAPTGSRAFVVTPERHVIIFDYNGTFGQFAWCDQEDITDWDFADVTSKAGELPVEPKAGTAAAIYSNGGTLHFTVRRPYIIRWTGLPYIYGSNPVSGDYSSPVSDRCVINTPETTMWVSENGFWGFNGVSISPIACSIWSSLKPRVDWVAARFSAAAVHMVDNSEIWFFLPELDTRKNNVMVIYNYVEGWWSKGKLCRTAGVSSAHIENPIVADNTTVYYHETGNSRPDVSELPWAKSHIIKTSSGDQVQFRQLQPDVEGDISGLRFSVDYRPTLATDMRSSPDRRIYDGFVSIDVSGKDFQLTVKSTNPVAGPWTFGESVADVIPRGRRSK